MDNKVSKKNHPLLSGAPGLFDSCDDVMQLNDKQHADAFYTRFVERHHPVSTYPKFFARNDVPIVVKEIKRLYIDYVIHGTWNDAKYSAVLVSIMSRRGRITVGTLDAHGVWYDKKKTRSSTTTSPQRRKRRL